MFAYEICKTGCASPAREMRQMERRIGINSKERRVFALERRVNRRKFHSPNETRLDQNQPFLDSRLLKCGIRPVKYVQWIEIVKRFECDSTTLKS